MTKLSLFAAAVSFSVATMPALAQDKPDSGAAAPAVQPPAGKAHGTKDKPPIYDEKADARAAIASAVARAAKENKRVMVQWGGNWCPWCHRLHETLKEDRGLAKIIQYEYEVVLVDVGHFDKNLDLAADYKAGFKDKGGGVPYLTILDGQGKVVVNQETGALEAKDAEGMNYDLAKVASFLKEHAAAPANATDVLAKGLGEAKASGRKVFLHFGAPWCGWCHKLEDWMARPEINGILAKDLVDVKIDTDRATGGHDMLVKMCGNDKSGIPWFVILDPADTSNPKPIITSDAPGKGNIGYPGQPEEIEHFIGMMKKAAAKMTPEDIETLRKSLSEKPKAAEGAPATAPMELIRPSGG